MTSCPLARHEIEISKHRLEKFANNVHIRKYLNTYMFLLAELVILPSDISNNTFNRISLLIVRHYAGNLESHFKV